MSNTITPTVAPDFPGYGESSAPSVNDFDYSYERLATVSEKFTEKLNLSSYALYLKRSLLEFVKSLKQRPK